MRCARCGRKLKHPVWMGGKPYGRICASKVYSCVNHFLLQEVEALKTQIRELRLNFQSLIQGGLPQHIQGVPALSPSPTMKHKNGDKDKPLGQGYGTLHTALMEELKQRLNN